MSCRCLNGEYARLEIEKQFRTNKSLLDDECARGKKRQRKINDTTCNTSPNCLKKASNASQGISPPFSLLMTRTLAVEFVYSETHRLRIAAAPVVLPDDPVPPPLVRKSNMVSMPLIVAWCPSKAFPKPCANRTQRRPLCVIEAVPEWPDWQAPQK
jgi:hypothetical protein